MMHNSREEMDFPLHVTSVTLTYYYVLRQGDAFVRTHRHYNGQKGSHTLQTSFIFLVH